MTAEISARKAKHIYIAWIGFQRRPESMQSYVGYDLIYIPAPFAKGWQKPFGYVSQTLKTWSVIQREKPDVVWYQAPPTFLAHILWAMRLLSPKRFKIVADCHNGAIDPRSLGAIWARMPLMWPLLRRFDLVLAHNAAVAEIARGKGLTEPQMQVLETRPAQIEPAPEPDPATRGFVLVPCSFQADEPIEMLLAAARLIPGTAFKLTGNVKRAEAKGYVSGAPANVSFTGYVTAAEYTALIRDCGVVLGLTSEEGVQLSAANEAVGAGKPLVLSDTQILRDLFGAAALFAANEPEPMARVLDEALSRRSDLAAASRALKETRETRWRLQADACLKVLEDA